MPCPRGMSLLDLSRIRSALERSTSPNTLRAYDQAWRRWVAWTKARGIRAMPATPELVAAFLTELADQGLSVATLRLQKVALGRAHRSIYTPDPTATQGVRRVMAGIAPGARPPAAPGKTPDRGCLGGGEGLGYKTPTAQRRILCSALRTPLQTTPTGLIQMWILKLQKC